jgi:hypothetical protein
MIQDVGEEHSNDGAGGAPASASPSASHPNHDADSEDDKSEVPSLKQHPAEINDVAVEDVAVELKHISQVIPSWMRFPVEINDGAVDDVAVDLIHESQVVHQAVYVPSPELDRYDMKGAEHDCDDATDKCATEFLLISPSTRMTADQAERKQQQQLQQQVRTQINCDKEEDEKVFDLPKLASISNQKEEKLTDQHICQDQNFETNLLALQAYKNKNGSPVSLPALSP